MKIDLVCSPERKKELLKELKKGYPDLKISLSNEPNKDISIIGDLDRNKTWNLNLDVMDKYKVTGSIIDYNFR